MGKINNWLLHFPSSLFTENEKRRRWHFRDPKLKKFLGEHAPRLPQVWGTFGALTLYLLPLRAHSNLTLRWLPVSYSLWNQCPWMEEETWSRRGLGGGGGVHFKNSYCQGGYNFHMYFSFGGGGGGGGLSLDTPHFSKTSSPHPLGRNKRSVPY